MKYWKRENQDWCLCDSRERSLLSVLASLSGKPSEVLSLNAEDNTERTAQSNTGNAKSNAASKCKSNAKSNAESNTARGAKVPWRIALAGAGGKTSLLLNLQKECEDEGKNVLVTTSTHMLLPEKKLLKEEKFNQMQDSEGEEHAGKKPVSWYLGTRILPEVRRDGWVKCAAPDPGTLSRYERKADVILTEADGSRTLPMKIPARWEPVIAQETDTILVVYGLSALGQEIHQVCHRPELLKTMGKLSGFLENDWKEMDRVSEALMAHLMRTCYLEPLRKKYPEAQIVPVWNQADTVERLEDGQRTAELCGWPLQLITFMEERERAFSREWMCQEEREDEKK